jgi:beta-glucosidase
MKKPFSKKRLLLPWGITTGFLVAILTAVTILANTTFYNLIGVVMGTGSAITTETEVRYATATSSKEAAKENGNDVAVDICSEGTVLLKNENNALPLASGAKISVFGKNSVNLVLGGSGSSGASGTEDSADLYTSLTEVGFSYNPTLKSFYDDDDSSGSGRPANPSIENDSVNVPIETGETPQSSYTTAVKDSYADYEDAALVVFSRIGGEGFDLPRVASDDSSKHYLQLDTNETDLLKAVCGENFNHVIILINSNSAMELGFLDDSTNYAYQSKIDGALWCGGFGNQGALAIGKILSGDVNPSGHLVDTYYRDFKNDPTYKNFGNNNVENGDRYVLDGTAKQYYFVQYEENVYLGYRYYETRGYLEGEDWYDSNVVFPFGYGLSYTTFDWEFTNKSSLNGTALSPEGTLTFDVKVTNTGSVAGKDVVQIYGNAPYTSSGIEKPYKVLLGFAKTDLLEAGASETVSVDVNPYYLASFDYNDANKNSFKGYELESGNYTFFVSHNAHESEDSATLSLASGHEYSNDPVTGYAVEPLFDDCDDTLSTELSRADFDGTFPTTPTEAERNVSEEFIDTLKSTATTNPISVSEMPTTGGSSVSLDIYDMIGKNYDDASWDELLNKPTIAEMENMFDSAAFNTAYIASVNKPKTTDADGPQGFTNFMGDPTIYGTCSYPSEPVVAATWNREMVEQEGKAIGEEGLWGNVQGDGIAYSGIYAPGINIHRSPFGGRNGEYYSEDGLLNGKMAAAFTTGAQSKGVYTYAKHFALNEQETHRSSNGDCSFVNEQAMREIYLRAFEIYVKEGGGTGIMTSFNRVGTTWAGGDYRLCTTVLRNEWGFKGAVICDFNTCNHMNPRQMAYAGGDLDLETIVKSWVNYDDPTDITVLKQATRHVLYMTANSNMANKAVLGYLLATWQVLIIVLDCVVFAGLAGWGVLVFLKIRKKTKVAAVAAPSKTVSLPESGEVISSEKDSADHPKTK